MRPGARASRAWLLLGVLAFMPFAAHAQPPIGTVDVGYKDFPAGVARGDRDRVSRYRLALAADGAVTDCTVVGRSGEPRLDSEGCRILRERARLQLRYGRRTGTIRFVWTALDDAVPGNLAGAPLSIGFAQRVAWNDYPPNALRFNRGGVVLFEVAVSANGAPTACRVTGSSGTPELDQRTCELAMARGAYIAASDGHGGRAAGLYRGRFTWRL